MMQDRDRDPGASPMISERTMHIVALAAIIVVGVALMLLTAEGARSVPNDAIDEAVAIEALPFQDDAVDLLAASTTTDEPVPSCQPTSHTAWYVLEPEVDIPLAAWIVPDVERDNGLDVALSVWQRTAGGTLAELVCTDDRAGGAAERVVMPARAGEVYYFGIGAEALRFVLEKTVIEVSQPEQDAKHRQRIRL